MAETEVFVPQSLTGIGRAREYLMHPERRSTLLSEVAEGRSLTEIAEVLGLRYVDLYRVLSTELRDEYLAAREAYANILAEKNLAAANAVEEKRMKPEAATATSKIRQWHMERSAPEIWGQKSTVNMNVKNVSELHLRAIRDLTDEPIEAEFTEVEDEVKEHPLL